MAVVRRAESVDLTISSTVDAEARAAHRGRMRRLIPVGIGIALAVAMLLMAAAGVFQSNAGVAGAKMVDPMGLGVLLDFFVAGLAMLRRVR